MAFSPGSMRPSQLITTFGPGAIVDLKSDSVMVVGTHRWPDGRIIHEHRLERALKMDHFMAPPVGKQNRGAHIPCVSFPYYRVCPNCGRLSDRFPLKEGKKVCDKCPGEQEVHPARFVMACSHGHVADFPWAEWAHRGKVCTEPELYLIGQGRTGALSDLKVECRACDKHQQMSGALGKQALEAILLHGCPRRRPWLGDIDPNACDATPRGLQRGASNVYFSTLLSALDIPPWTQKLQKEIAKHWSTFKALAENGQRAIIPTLLAGLFPGKNPTEVMAAIDRRLNPPTNPDLRKEEWEQLTAGHVVKDENFSTEPAPVPPDYAPWLRKLILVKRLREVRVLTGFTRIDPPDPESGSGVHRAPLSAEALDWLPAVEVHGEGLFLEFDPEKISEWEDRAEVKGHCDHLIDTYVAWRKARGWTDVDAPPRRLILLHTLAHLLIRQLALECGYSSASIRERIYASEDMCGLLLYTATPDADGSLGGLIQQGLGARFTSLVEGALASAEICSSDPLCSEHSPKITGRLHGAACHACSFASETSCELSNRLLDRALIHGLPDQPSIRFFTPAS